MTFATTRSIALLGVRGVPVEVEAHLGRGLSRFSIIGLPDTVLTEARDRVRAAVLNSGEPWPDGKITVSLSPAWIRKQGSAFDASVAIAVLAAGAAVPRRGLAGLALFAELGLDGRLRPVLGVLPAALAAVGAGLRRLVVAEPNTAEADQVPGLDVWGPRSLRGLLARLRGLPEPDDEPDPAPPVPVELVDPSLAVAGSSPDLSAVLGQYEARRALEISAAGRHHLLLCGAPGAGKTMLAERMPGLLPPLDREAALEVSAVHSLSGTLPAGRPLLTDPPFCSVHHSATVPAMVGGGSGVLRPGAVSRAHHGVLFLDEMPEFGRVVLDSLREPMECGEVVIARVSGAARFPARFLLVGAANPCPCGYASESKAPCSCGPAARGRYLSRLSGPLLDRIDLRVDVRPVGRAELLGGAPLGEPTSVVADRVKAARERAAARLAGTPWRHNGEVPGHALRSRWPLPESTLAAAERALDLGTLSARGLDRISRVAWTIADLAGRDRPSRDDVDSALALRLAASTTGRR